MSEQVHETLLSRELRLAWLEVGGFVAAADGLSEQEASELAGMAAGPDLDVTACMLAIQAGAACDALSETTLELVKGADPYVQVQCLCEVYSAAASDGSSEAELALLRDVVAGTLGEGKVASFMRLCELQCEVASLFSDLVLGD